MVVVSFVLVKLLKCKDPPDMFKLVNPLDHEWMGFQLLSMLGGG